MKRVPWISLGILAFLWGIGSWFAWIANPESMYDLNPLGAAAFVGAGLLLCVVQVVHGIVKRHWIKVAIFLACPTVFFGQMAARGLLS